MSKFGWSYPPGAADDPNAPYNQTKDWEYECDQMRDALKDFDTGRWDWEKIDCALTGKDADLEPWGDQGIEVSCCDDENVDCVAHIMKTIAGHDVCLAKEYETIEEQEKAIEEYLEQAQETVIGCSVPGEWDGDSWVLSDTVPFQVAWVFNGDDVDYQKTAQAIIDAAEKELEPIEEELRLMDNIINIIAGYKPRETDK